jgi:ABC-type glycerol-3-phosphate transport system permease component
VALALICAVMLFPLLLMITNSFSDSRQFLRMPPRITPQRWTVENYAAILALPLLPRWLANTVLVAVLSIVGGVLVNGAAGYAFAVFKARWMTWLFWAMMAPIFVTGIMTIIARFVVVSRIGLRGLPAVVLMNLFWSTGIFLFRNYFREIPVGILESARLDGAGEWTVLTHIVLPISRPIVGCAVVFLGMGALGDYIWQMLNLQQAEQQTFVVGMIAAATDVYMVKNIGRELAIGTLLFLPVMLLFAVSSRYFIGGLTGGALKE